MDIRDKITVVCSWIGDNTVRANEARKFFDELNEENTRLAMELERVKNNSFISDVSQRSELLKLEDKNTPFDTWLDKYFKPSPTTELIYRQKNNNVEFTEKELIRKYKQAYQL